MIVLSDSSAFRRHLAQALPDTAMTHVQSLRGFPEPGGTARPVCLVHLASTPVALDDSLVTLLRSRSLSLAVASDEPDLNEFLRLSRFELAAYLNSYMADLHYRQMLQVVQAGQAWVVPPIMDQALHRARTATTDDAVEAELLGRLTPRERDVALAVRGGLSNPEIGARLGISEATVKVHLGRIFRKLGSRNRYALALKLQDLPLAS